MTKPMEITFNLVIRTNSEKDLYLSKLESTELIKILQKETNGSMAYCQIREPNTNEPLFSLVDPALIQVTAHLHKVLKAYNLPIFVDHTKSLPVTRSRTEIDILHLLEEPFLVPFSF